MPDILLYADVILPLPLPKLFTYSISKEHINKLQPGMRVVIQFGAKKFYTAIVKEIHKNKPEKYAVKEIASILDNEAIISKKQFEFWEWIANYYMCSLGEVYKAALPSGLKLESEAKILIDNNFTDTSKLNKNETIVFNVLTNKNTLTVKEINNLFEQKNALSIIKSLLDKKAIIVLERLKENYKPKTEKYISLSKKYRNKIILDKTLSELEKAPKQLKILIYYLQLSDYFSNNKKELAKKTLLTKAKVSTNILTSLLKKGILEEHESEVGRLTASVEKTSPINKLNTYQEKALTEIKQSFNDYNVTLLYGVTSSGKTEIYIHLISEIIKSGKQVLYLLPEIALTAQIINRLKKVFGNKIGIYHSKFSDAERVETWQNVRQKKNYQVILGVRSSIFLPYSNLGLIIVDEEHENTYKQYNPAPRYNARDASIMLAKKHGAKVLLGTATPAIETYYNATNNRYGLVNLTQRYKDIDLPEIILSDVSEARRKKKMRGIFTPIMLEYIDEALCNGEQIILFQNRRGFSSYLICNVCGWVPKCTNCDVSLTYHKGINRLVCHYCGYSTSLPKNCEACGMPSMRTMGFGTEQIEDEISAIFPNCKVARLDLDTTRTKTAYQRIIGDFEVKAVDILIGTQMLSKGLNFDNVSVVGILNADNMLHFPDFRSFERSFQLMTQVSGRAGRKYKQGKVIIQSSDITHQIIVDVQENNYQNMYKQQLEERKCFKYPPFYRLLNITLKHKNSSILNHASKLLSVELRQMFGNRVLGPEIPLIGRIQNLYLKSILIKIEKKISHQKAKTLLHNAINNIKVDSRFKSVQIVVNIDPM